jgi:hypothetical protein
MPPPRRCSVSRGPCKHLGEQNGEETCATCHGNVRIKTFECGVHGRCTLGKKLDGIACCPCQQYEAG